MIFIILFLICPVFREIQAGSQGLIFQKKEIAVLQEKISNLQQFKSLYSGLKDVLEKIDDLFVDPEVPVEFIGFLEETAEDYNLEIKISPSLGKKTEKEIWPCLIFQVNNTGKFEGFLKFLERVENSQYLVEIRDLNVSLLEKENEIKAAFSVKVYTRENDQIK